MPVPDVYLSDTELAELLNHCEMRAEPHEFRHGMQIGTFRGVAIYRDYEVNQQ